MKTPATQRARSPAARGTLSATRRLMSEQLDLVFANEPGVLAGEVEPLHDMRVALRRLRTLLRAFGKACALPGADRMERRLDRLQKALGPARDADVLIAILESRSVLRLLEGLDERERIVERQRELLRERKEAVRILLAGATYKRLKRDAAAFVRAIPDAAPGGARTPALRRVAETSIRKGLERIRKRTAMPPSHPPPAVHRLRIACRRARYLCEFFAPILGKETAALALKLKTMQDVLGDIHDLDVLTAELEREHIAVPPALVKSLVKRRARLLRQFDPGV